VSDSPVVAEFPPDKDVCYGRVYSREHLAAHPDQNVTEIYLARLLSQDPESEGALKTREQFAAEEFEGEREAKTAIVPDAPEIRPGRISLEMYVRFRDKPKMFLGGMECEGLTAGGFTCRLVCHNGEFSAKLNGKTLIMRQSSCLIMEEGCSGRGASAPEIPITPKDKGAEFLLEPAPAATC
jgi:hypothetical protein